MAKLIVYYPRHEGHKFDRDYYKGTHMDVVNDAWGPHGLIGADVSWPYDDSQPFACLVALNFGSQDEIDAALGSPGTPGVLADVARFTDIEPAIYRTA